MNRRLFLSRAALAPVAVGAIVGGVAYRATSQTAPRRIAIKASKFEFSPSEVTVERGRPVTLVITATDYAHGFDLSDFKVRRDLIPGKEVELSFTPDKVGRFVFVCDNFCGDGHDDMSGVLIVKEAPAGA